MRKKAIFGGRNRGIRHDVCPEVSLARLVPAWQWGHGGRGQGLPALPGTTGVLRASEALLRRRGLASPPHLPAWPGTGLHPHMGLGPWIPLCLKAASPGLSAGVVPVEQLGGGSVLRTDRGSEVGCSQTPQSRVVEDGCAQPPAAPGSAAVRPPLGLPCSGGPVPGEQPSALPCHPNQSVPGGPLGQTLGWASPAQRRRLTFLKLAPKTSAVWTAGGRRPERCAGSIRGELPRVNLEITPSNFPSFGGARVAKRLTLDFDSGRGLTVCGMELRAGLCADGTEPAWDSLSLSLPRPPLVLSPSHK